jgi:hypothetical protein
MEQGPDEAQEQGQGGGMRLADFLVDLAQDPELLDAFVEDPERVLAQTDLAPTHVDVMLSGDAVAIREAVYEEIGQYLGLIIIKLPKPIIKSPAVE